MNVLGLFFSATAFVSSLTSSPASTATALNQTETGTEEITVQPVSNTRDVKLNLSLLQHCHSFTFFSSLLYWWLTIIISFGMQESSEECNIRKRTREHNLGSSTPVVQPKDTTLVLPFVKKSPFWKILETSEVFQRAPQSPHFSPLVKESKEQFREGLAFGMMLTYSSLLESFKDLEPHVPISELNSLKASLAELEKHGFSVSAPLARINKLLSLKETQLKKMEERNSFNREIMALEEGVGEMEHKILELERQQVALKEQRDAAYQNVCQIQSFARDNGIELDNLESEFKATSSTPW